MIQKKVYIIILSLAGILLFGCNFGKTAKIEAPENNDHVVSIIEKINIEEIDGQRLKVLEGNLYMDEELIGKTDTVFELNDLHYGWEAYINTDLKLYWLRYALSDVPPPYTPYLSKIFLKQKEMLEIPVKDNFILDAIYAEDEILWLSGNYRSGRTTYWDVLYLYNISSGKLQRINDTFYLNSISIIKMTTEYADVQVWHNPEQPPLKEDYTNVTEKKNYRVFSDGSFENLN